METISFKEKHPAALYWLFFTEMWERFSYYGMRALLILYLTSEISKGGLAWTSQEAGQLYGLYTGFSYIVTLIGGYLADRYLGFRGAVFIGGFMMAIAQFSLATGSAFGIVGVFYVGLVLLVLGNGFFKPNISSMVGQFYEDGSKLKDSAYTIFYMGINIGAFLGALICGYLGEKVGWQYGFASAGIGMVSGMIIFQAGQKSLGNVGLKPALKKQAEVTTVEPLTRTEIEKLAVAITLSIFSIIFWASFEQAGSSMNIFAARYTDRNIGGFEVPATWFQSINALFIFTLAPIFSWLWVYLESKKLNPNGPVKFAMGLLFVALGFWVLVMGSSSIPQGAKSAQVSMLWLILAYLLHTIGELCLSPVGLSFINKLSPKRFLGLMFGIWFLCSGLGNYLGGYISGFIGETDKYKISDFFMIVVIIPLVSGIVLLLLSPILKKWMHGVK
ncbi:MAG: peptide MFS transporter [Microscillaceae bacterium]|nr:peptide MFS transporter [Microscillaceae bacterium]MDW8461595.1 peptide MFS transporter [Cytophagales bacterium]